MLEYKNLVFHLAKQCLYLPCKTQQVFPLDNLSKLKLTLNYDLGKEKYCYTYRCPPPDGFFISNSLINQSSSIIYIDILTHYHWFFKNNIIHKKKPLISEWVVFCILMVSFSVYYLGVYMFLGLMNLFIFSVSTTLKSYVIIMPYNKINVNRRK